MKTRIKGTVATYRYSNRKEDVCDLEKVAEHYGSVGNIPKHIGWGRACEIAMLARYFSILWRDYKRREKLKTRKTCSQS